jgi:hypothetical protein
MPQLIVALFDSYNDGHEALRALQALGLSRDHGHLYQAGKRSAAPSIPVDTPELDWRVHESAEYAAHGERPGAGANRYKPETGDLGLSADTAGRPSIDATTRTLLIIGDTSGLRAAAACGMLYDYGAVAIKDAAGHWRFSPHRRVCRSQES